MNRKTLLSITFVLCFVLLFGSISIIIFSQNPEQIIQGKWDEKGWYFERTETPVVNEKQASIDDEMRGEILKDLEIPHATEFVFNDDKTFEVNGNQKHHPPIKWNIKGRGHILELTQDGKLMSSFQIEELNEKRLILHLNFDLQVKGIVKIVLEKKE